MKVDEWSKNQCRQRLGRWRCDRPRGVDAGGYPRRARLCRHRVWRQPWHFDHSDIATAVFSQPEVGTVGLSEADARKAYGADIDIYKTNFKPMKNALNGDTSRVLMKLVVRASDEKVLGVHMVGDDAAEIIQAIGIAIKMGVTKPDFDRTCAVHPSVAEELVTMRTKWVPDVASNA